MPPLSSCAASQLCAAITTLPASWRRDAPTLAYAVLPIRLHCCSHLCQRHRPQHSAPPLLTDVDLQKSMHGTQDRHVSHKMRTTCLHGAHCIPVRNVMKSWFPACEPRVPCGATVVTTSALCLSVPFPEGAVEVSGVPGPPKKSTMSPSSATASLPALQTLKHCSFHIFSFIHLP